MKNNDLSIVIVNWNTSSNIKKCLTSIKKHTTDIKCDVYVVDNSSIDNSIEMIKKYFPWVKLIANKENVGFAKANNQVLKNVKSKYVFTVNPDIEFLDGTLEKLFEFLRDNPKAVACSPIMLNHDLTIQKKGYYHKFPSLIQALLFYTNLLKISNKISLLKNLYWESNLSSDKVFEVDQLPGACIFAYRKSLAKVNFFDERYPLLFEDVDLSYKLKNEGHKLYVVPSSRVIHEGGASFKKLDDGIAHKKFLIGLIIFFDLHKNLLERILIRIIVYGHLLFLVAFVSFKYIIKPTSDKPIFIKNKLILLRDLLHNNFS